MIAEIEPEVKTTTVQGKTDYEPLFEIIDGQRVELPPMSILSSRVASALMSFLGYYAYSNGLGCAVMEALLRLPIPVDRNRRPDLAYISNETIAKASPQPGSDNAWNVLPELFVEVISPSDLAEEILERINEYFAAGTKLVWVVYPTQKLIYVYESPQQVRILGKADELDGGSALSGFRVAIASLFPGE